MGFFLPYQGQEHSARKSLRSLSSVHCLLQVFFLNVFPALAHATRVFPEESETTAGDQVGLILNVDNGRKAGPNPERGVKFQESSFSLFNSIKPLFFFPKSKFLLFSQHLFLLLRNLSILNKIPIHLSSKSVNS